MFLYQTTLFLFWKFNHAFYYLMGEILFLKLPFALASWLSWLEHHPVQQKVASSIASQGTYLSCGFDPWLGCVWEVTIDVSHIDVSLSLSFKSINISSSED